MADQEMISFCGGKGRDILRGGLGYDDYVYSTVDGDDCDDVIEDSDGLGRVVIGKRQLTGGKGEGPIYEGQDGTKYIWNGIAGSTMTIINDKETWNVIKVNN